MRGATWAPNNRLWLSCRFRFDMQVCTGLSRHPNCPNTGTAAIRDKGLTGKKGESYVNHKLGTSEAGKIIWIGADQFQ
jgi:hypothetical protein